MKGFTFIEILIVIAILIVLASLVVAGFGSFQKESDLANSTEKIISTLQLAQNKTLASEKDSQYGVYFETASWPHQYILFKGTSYQLREAIFDEITQLPKTVEIYQISLAGEASQVVFDKVTGTTSQFGQVSLRLKNNPDKAKTIDIQSSGKITLGLEALPTFFPEIDSRHVHFNYSRNISLSSEKLNLIFETTNKEIILAENLKDNQIYWEGEIDVSGQRQKLKIHTHKLNDPIFGTIFSFHRDRRYNNQPLQIQISGDTTGDLIQYNADGQTTKGSSIYVSQPEWQ